MQLPFNKATLTHYELILTENCNFRCKYCFDDSFSDRSSCSYDYVMPVSIIPDLYNFIDKTKDSQIVPNISFFGGEPTMNWEFIEEFINQSKKTGRNFNYSMNTNLSLLNSEKLDFLVQNRVGLIISLDGMRPSHNSARVFKGGTGTWNSIMKVLPLAIAKYKNSPLPITVMMVVTKDNFKELEANYCFLWSLGFKEVNILWNFESNFTTEDLQELKIILTRMFKEKHFRPYLDLKRRIWNNDFRNTNKNPSPCVEPGTSVTISPKGNLFFCHRLVPKMVDTVNSGNYKESFGNIKEGYTNLEYLQYVKNRIDINSFEKTHIPCQDCSARDICKGGCIGTIRDNTPDYIEYPKMCQIYKMLAEVFN